MLTGQSLALTNVKGAGRPASQAAYCAAMAAAGNSGGGAVASPRARHSASSPVIGELPRAHAVRAAARECQRMSHLQCGHRLLRTAHVSDDGA